MAIAETEPKKSEVGVSSTGVSQTVKAFDCLKTLAKSKESCSGIRKSLRSYGLYSNVMDFSFHMPDGWNDQDIAILVDSCWENIDKLQNESIDVTSKWQAIVDHGAQKSDNPTLFNINSCLEVAQCIRQYVSRNMDKTSNDVFNKFCKDVVNLIPYFPGSNNQNNRHRLPDKILELKDYLVIFREEKNSKKLEEAVVNYLPRIATATPGVWNELAKTVGDSIGIYLNIKAFFEMSKQQVIQKWNEETDPQKRKEIFNQSEPFLKMVFDYVVPVSVKTCDFILGINRTVDIEGKIDKGESVEVEARVRGGEESVENNRKLRSSSLATNDCTLSSPEPSQITSPIKRKKGRPRKVLRNFIVSEEKKTSDDVRGNTGERSASLEPTSTTHLDEGLPPGLTSTYSHQVQKKMDVDGKLTLEETIQSECQKEPVSTYVRKRRERPPPTRILPSRQARNKPLCPTASKRAKSQTTLRHSSNYSQTFNPDGLEYVQESAKRSPNFRGFEDTDSDLASEEETTRKLRFVRKVTTTQRTFTRTLPNPDTTTDDLDDSESISAQNSTDDDMSSYVRRLTRQAKESLIKGKYITEEKVENKVTTVNYVNADSTNFLNPVVKLRQLKKSEIGEGARRNLSSTYIRNIDEKGLTLSALSPKPNIPVESAVLARDVVKSVYNPNSDTAKTHAGPGSPTNSHRAANRTQRGNCPSPSKSRREVKDSQVHYDYYTDSDDSGGYEEMNSKMDRNCISRIVCRPDKKGQMSLQETVGESFLNSEREGENPERLSHNSLFDRELSPEMLAMVAQQSDSEPSTSTSADTTAFSPEVIKAVLKKFQHLKSQDLSIPSYNSSQRVDLYHNKPLWMNEVMTEFRRQQMWKMQHFVRMQQEIVDLERKKVSLIEDLSRYIKKKDRKN